MNDEIIRVRVASMITDAMYDRLRIMAGNDQESDIKYKETIDKLKKCIYVENNEYKRLSEEDLLSCLIDIENNNYNHLSLPRHYRKLMHEKQIREGSPKHNNILLSEAITAKMLIDVLKNLSTKLDKINNMDELDEEDMIILNIIHKVHKFNYLTTNNYIELIALKHEFDIKRLPLLFFSEIENNFNVRFIDNSKPLFIKYATNSIDEMLKTETNDKHAKAYNMMFELSRIECVLNYMDFNSANTLKEYVDYNYPNNEIISTVKRLIKKRKEELD